MQHAKWLPLRLQTELRRLEKFCTAPDLRQLDAGALKRAVSDLLMRINERLRPQDIPPIAM
jgi:hypothetical protein